MKGGFREGSGRKKQGVETTSIQLTPTQKEKLKKLGMSEYIRSVLDGRSEIDIAFKLACEFIHRFKTPTKSPEFWQDYFKKKAKVNNDDDNNNII